MKTFIALTLLVSVLSFSGPLTGQTDIDVTEAGILELQDALDSGRVTSVQLVDAYLARIAAYDRQGPRLNSLVRVNPEARAIAAALDRERQQSGSRGPLHGIPVIVKDNYNTVDLPTTASSVALAGFRPSANATQVDRLIDAGAIILAKSNLHEFAYGITSISSLGGQTRNPYDPRRAPGGSSGGTGAAVAASLGTVGMGSDTCGSIRIPSAFNNQTGLRPSKGLSSIYGIIPLSHTQDVGGPLARSVTDLAIVLDAVAGYDPLDEATRIMQNRAAPDFFGQLESVELEGLRLGRLTEYFDRADSTVAAALDETLERLQRAGVEIVDVNISGLEPLIADSGLIGFEFKPDLNAYLSEFGSDDIVSLTDIVEQGLYHRAVGGALGRSQDRELDRQAYRKAQATRSQLRQLVETQLVYQQLDALVYPTIGMTQVFTGESQPGSNCSLSANSGLPAISVPAGFTSSGLPTGLELLGPFLSDTRLVATAYRIEQLTSPRQTPIATPPLVNGVAPAPRQAAWFFNHFGLTVSGTLTYDRTTRELGYALHAVSADSRRLHAVTLHADNAPLGDFLDPAAANLLPPDSLASEGTVFISTDLHQAIQEGRIYLRVFAENLPSAGLAVPVNF